MKILLTGFEPFDGDTINPALEAVRRVQAPRGVELIRLPVPTVFSASIDTVTAAMQLHHPHAVVCVGQAAGRSQITPERVAINLDDARIPDNSGAQPEEQPVRAGGPAAYFSTLPVRTICSALLNAGIPASVSNSAGTFVCNHLMYGMLDFISRQMPSVCGGFIHVPCTPEQAAHRATPTPSMALPDIIRALELILSVLADA